MGLSAETAAQRLRQELTVAIESLSPGPGVSVRAPQARVYNLLIMHYVEGRTVQEVAHKLGISRRQAHRDLRKAIESVATVWWARRSNSVSRESGAAQLSSIHEEVARLEQHFRQVDLFMLVQRAQETVSGLALQRGVRLCAESPEEPGILSTDPVIAEQVLVNILSHAVQQTLCGDLDLLLTGTEGRVALRMRYYTDPKTEGMVAADQATTQLVDRLGWRVEQTDQPHGPRTVVLHMESRVPTVLVIDDNEGLVRLVERLLTDHAYRVVPAANGQEGLALAQDMLPDAIVLDVMMPEMSGWEVLQRLRNHPKTLGIPVVICSVFNSPELAYSLGASLFVPKPISRDDVLGALVQLGLR
jgi:CheY-like chemotaxis protein